MKTKLRLPETLFLYVQGAIILSVCLWGFPRKGLSQSDQWIQISPPWKVENVCGSTSQTSELPH